MLGMKKRITDEQWLHAWEHCTEIISLEEMMLKEREAINKLVRHLDKYEKVAFGYTAGKDSIALAELIRVSGIEAQSLMWITPLQFPVIKEWNEKHMPRNTIVLEMNYGGYDFLEKNPDYLFSQNNTIDGWMSKKWKEQKSYLESEGYDCFITGRRTLDHNNCGSAKDDYIKKGKKYDTFNLIADWKHEEVLAYIKYRGLELPPCYFWNRGFKIGSGAWAERDAYERTETEMWEEIYSIDPSVVREASEHLTSAKKYMEYRKMRGMEI